MTAVASPSRSISPEEKALRTVFQKIRATVDTLSEANKEKAAAIRKGLTEPEKALVDAWFTEGRVEVARRLLCVVGQLYRTEGRELLFFRHRDHRLYDLYAEEFRHYLIQVTGNTDLFPDISLQKFQAWTRFEAPEVQTYFLAYNAPGLDVIAVNTFDGFMMRRKRDGTWESVENGRDGVLFKTPPDFLSPWRPEFNGAKGQDVEWLCSLGHFAADGALSIDDQRGLLRVWLLHLFMPEVNPVHPVPLNEGITGSGKSVEGECFGRWLTGPEFEVMDLPSGDATKAEESLKIALCKRPLVVLDNVDSPALWLEDFLCRYATGVRMSRRRLYTDQEEVHFHPWAGLIITSREPHFRREDVARRLLPIRFTRIPEGERRTETDLRREVDERRSRIWADVLDTLGAVQDAWPTEANAAVVSHSLADFAVFGEVVAVAAHREDHGQSVADIRKEWRALMGRLEAAQGRFSTEEDPLVEVLRLALAKNGSLGPQRVADLFNALRDIARAHGLSWAITNAAALTKRLNAKQTGLEEALGARIVLDPHHRGGTYRVTITKSRDEDEAGLGGDDFTKRSDLAADTIRAFLRTRPDRKADAGWIFDHCAARAINRGTCAATLKAMAPEVAEVEPGVWQLVSGEPQC